MVIWFSVLSLSDIQTAKFEFGQIWLSIGFNYARLSYSDPLLFLNDWQYMANSQQHIFGRPAL